MKKFIFLALALTSCTTPVYVNKEVMVPVSVPCKVHLPEEVILPTQMGQDPKAWQEQLALVLEDLKILKKELEETQLAAKGCE